MRDLSVQASNAGGLNDEAKGNIQSEIAQLKSELNRIAETTTFNGKKLLDGSFNATFQVGANSGETISFSIGAPAAGMDSVGLGVSGVNVEGDATNAMAATTVNATADGTTATASTVTTSGLDFTAADPDWGSLNGTLSLNGKSLDLSTVKGAGGTTPALADLTAALTSTFGAGVVTAALSGTDLEFTTAAPAATATMDEVAAASLTFAEHSGASEAIDLLDEAIKTVSTQRADLGAIQNRFDHTINNLNVAVENLTASESRIRDADMAQEMVQFTRNQILSQAGTAMLAQANQASQGVLSLLR
jgi:flagellin